MARYRIEDKVVDTDKATADVPLSEVRVSYGYDSPRLYRSKRGRWYLVHDYNWCEDGRTLDYAEWLSPEEAVRLLLENWGDADAILAQTQAEWPELADALTAVAE